MAATVEFLSGLRVLDLSIWRPGPYATSLLVPLGADVLKVEPPGGDPMRHYPGLFAGVNEGKRSLRLDLKDADDRSRALELAAQADVLVEGFRPGVLARLGLDEATVRALNPTVVYCSLSGYGQHDPRALLPGHDLNYQAWSGALTPEGGPADRIPPLPMADLAAGLTAAFGGTTDWDTSAGEDKYRRALYTQWRRTTPYPSMTTFDAPSRNVCTISRQRTNTPLQALVTLNDPVYVEAAQALGRRMVKEGGATLESKLQYGVRLCLTRPAREVEMKRLVELYTKAQAEYAKNSKLATQLATEPIGPLPAGTQAPEMAAWTVVGNVLLNLDEMFAKR